MEQVLTTADPDDATSSWSTSRIRALTDAAVAIHAPTDVAGVLRALGGHAARLTGAARAVVSLTRPGGAPGERWAQTSIQVIPDGAGAEELPDACLEPLFTTVCEGASPLRLTAEELSARPDRPTSRGPHLPDGAWLAAPLVARDGSSLGLVQLCGGDDDTFTEVDEALLVQLAQVASIAIEKSQLQAELADQQASRFREELLSGISHDMQTPLAAIMGLAEMMVTEPPPPEDERAEIHETIARQARSLRGLVQQFLDFTRIESDRPLLVRPRPTDVVAAVDRVVSLFEHRRELVVGVSQNLPEAMADPDRLDQILANLVSNAIKYSDAPIRVVARAHRDRVVVDVVDEGPGIEDDELERVFDKFQRGRTAAGTSGTGLGLYITQALIETQGAELSVHTSPGVGSRFSVSMPAV